ncbi:type IV pilus twitching motility protein PilT [Mahella sp.]|uniref:type IV pilus twitching motility protein PilT n=1 Tax=Mahella sp. TaxID=2798721 RepID=UPI0025BBB722|nr:type IV pilus twitching motility protein PilT [Mahella sp.]
MFINELLKEAVERKASDLHITVNMPPIVRINGELVQLPGEPLSPADTESLAHQMTGQRQLEQLAENGECDFSFSVAGLGRFRVNVYKQRGTYSAAVRALPAQPPDIGSLGLPDVVRQLAETNVGIVLVTGPTGSGKSTTLAAMIDYINEHRSCHILTMEDPIEYLHRHKKSIVNQREIGSDTKSYAAALRSALREDPDVILVGEMRDLETISIAITAAETGHLVLSTLHTIGAARTIDRIVDVFPPHQQQQIRVQLSMVIQGVISQQLMPRADGTGRVVAVEIMVATPAIRNLIRENKTYQIISAMQTGSRLGMRTMDSAIQELYNKGIITKETAAMHFVEKNIM